MIKWLAARIDTVGAKRMQHDARTGWASTSCSDIKFLSVGGVQFRYRERGQGKTIVFAADPPVTVECYDTLLELYSKDYRVVVFELPAQGFSHADFNFDFRFRGTNDAMAEFIRQVVGEPCVLAFSCVSGLGGVDIAGRYPDLVSHLILIQTPSWDEEVRWRNTRDPKGLIGIPFVGQLLMKQLRKNRAPGWFSLVLGRTEHMSHFCGCAKETLSHGAGWKLASAFQNYLTDQCPELRPVKAPTLALWGKRDGSHQTTDYKSSLWMSSGHTEIEIYEDIGHFPELEDVDLIFERVSRFIKNENQVAA